MESKLASLHIDLPTVPKPKPKRKGLPKKDEVVESWEDDDLSSLDDTPTPTEGAGSELKPAMSQDPALKPPPPTPISPENADQHIDWAPAQVLGGGRPKPYGAPSPSTPTDIDREQRRPETTTATASRLIAAGLGIKPPKKTEEQRQYDRAVREQELRRRNKEKEEKEREREAEEKAKAAVWDE
ncbi:hypothetical protein A1O3_09636 [Capronia epimyces CBS 606.96]|uniref:Uncharacterized protein n=1 Tax=Capronia epimyces CBS 606.96 TaxID=1182542 RepID=W9XJA2_9EURO|nr:uncharacterized protein A1O3_09636 [Capronia epimyces CBS 606.96]EXJ77410.1 hypothetical protein A1O3_09636 [Capronia epimyces CBS 606.96]